MSMTIKGPDGKLRCKWCSAAPEFLAYHDTEWGFPVSDDHRLFEKLGVDNDVELTRLAIRHGMIENGLSN